MRCWTLLLLCLAACSDRTFDADRAFDEGRRIDARKRFGESDQDRYDRVNRATRGIVDRLTSIPELESLVRLCEAELRRQYVERSALFDLKMSALFRLSEIGGTLAAESLVRLFREELNWDGEAGYWMCHAIYACGPAALPALDRWSQEEKDSHGADLAGMIRSGQSP